MADAIFTLAYDGFMRIATLLLLLPLPIFCVCSSVAQEQVSFSTEGEIKKPVALPHAVEEIVMRDHDVRDTMLGERVPMTMLPKEWYRASEVHLAEGELPAIVVVGHAPIGGAHAAWFWVCARQNGRWVLLLRATGDMLNVQPNRTHGWNEMETSYYTASVLYSWSYRFDGRRYRLLKESQKPLR